MVVVAIEEKVGRQALGCPGKSKVFSPKDMRRVQWEGTETPGVRRALHDAFTPLSQPAVFAAGDTHTFKPAVFAAGGTTHTSKPASSIT